MIADGESRVICVKTAYTVATVGKEAPHKVLKELLPLYVPLLIALMVITYVPELTMWLPSLL